jgi:hypothetical protein
MSAGTTIQPVEIKLHQQSRLLEIAFDDGARFELPCEYLRESKGTASLPARELESLARERAEPRRCGDASGRRRSQRLSQTASSIARQLGASPSHPCRASIPWEGVGGTEP